VLERKGYGWAWLKGERASGQVHQRTHPERNRTERVDKKRQMALKLQFREKASQLHRRRKSALVGKRKKLRDFSAQRTARLPGSQLNKRGWRKGEKMPAEGRTAQKPQPWGIRNGDMRPGDLGRCTIGRKKEV